MDISGTSNNKVHNCVLWTWILDCLESAPELSFLIGQYFYHKLCDVLET